MIVNNCAQHSDSWWEARRSVPTASNFHRIISSKKPFDMKPVGANSYICELIAECATQNPSYFTEKDRITRNRETQYGLDTEDEACGWLAMHLDRPLYKVGFITTDDEHLGASPDRVGKDSEGRITEVCEVKCPRLDTHAKYLMNPGEVPKEYIPQIHGQLVVTGLDHGHFLRYGPGLDPLYVLVTRNEYTEKLEKVLKQFLDMYHPRLHEMFPAQAEVDAWRKFLRTDPPLADFNARLPTMSRLSYEVKRRVLNLCQGHARLAGLTFDEHSRTFITHRSEQLEESYF